jgi:hypothetical protein
MGMNGELTPKIIHNQHKHVCKFCNERWHCHHYACVNQIFSTCWRCIDKDVELIDHASS